MKMWQKISIFLLVSILAISAVLLFKEEEKACCLCNSFRYHAPCLIDLETGELVELGLYFPHETLVAELADSQPQQDIFSFVELGNVSGYADTSNGYIEIAVPVTERITNPALCKTCKKQLSGLLVGRYVLADLYNRDDKKLIPIQADLSMEIRCYRITAQAEEDILKLIIQGILEKSF